MNKTTAGIGGSILLIILAVLSVLLGTDLVEKYGNDVDNDNSTPAADANPDWYEIYFTNPSCPPAAERTGGLDETIAEEIGRAKLQVDVAGYDIDAEPIINALIDLRARGLTVRVVTDSDNGDLPGIRRLRRGGISVVEDKRTGLMHDKFIVVDGRYVWMGSLNYTTNGVYCNNNNLVRFDSSRLAANYTAEMDEMYDKQQFGPDSPNNTPKEKLTINGIEIENYFGSEKEISPIIARAVTRAQEEILFMAFSFTDEQIGEAMLGRADAGVTLRGVFETVGSDTGSSYFPVMAQDEMTMENIAVRTDGNPQIMHHKVIIIDRETVIFGSFNFSDSANRRNDENIIIVHDPTFAGYFIDEFDTVWAEADNPSQ
ncbi:MAG: hypothetical protein H6667_07185 [Ardenticatenaceae bacterium]|nr:hypothetical protein [Ardenticatenaceae bacterium]